MKGIAVMLWDFIVENYIATEEEVSLVTGINGMNESTMLDIIFVRTGNRSYEQCKLDGLDGTDELDEYYGLNEEEDEDE